MNRQQTLDRLIEKNRKENLQMDIFMWGFVALIALYTALCIAWMYR